MSHIRVDLSNTTNKWIEFGLANVDMFIIRVGFGLMNIDTIRTLIQHEHDPLTRIVVWRMAWKDTIPKGFANSNANHNLMAKKG